VTGVTVSVVSLVPSVQVDDDDDGTECNEKDFYLHPLSSDRCRVCDSSINNGDREVVASCMHMHRSIHVRRTMHMCGIVCMHSVDCVCMCTCKY